MWDLWDNFLLLEFFEGFFKVFTSAPGGRGVLGGLKCVLRDFLGGNLVDFSS